MYISTNFARRLYCNTGENLATFSLKILSIKQNKPLKQSLIKLIYLLNYLNYMNLLSKNGDIS